VGWHFLFFGLFHALQTGTMGKFDFIISEA